MRRNFKILILIVAVIGFVSVAAFGWLYWQKTSHTELPSLLLLTRRCALLFDFHVI